MKYSDIPVYPEVTARLSSMAVSKKVPHALMFTGADGCGALPAAHAFAQHLFCKSPGADGGCGTCPSCSRVSKLEHPDLHLVFPIAKSKHVRSSADLVSEFRESYLASPFMTLGDWFNSIDGENKQPSIQVEEAADILRKLSYTSYEGGWKILLVWCVDTMNVQASNKLLKILEEPPDDTVFILVTSKPDQLLATIISRVQQIKFAPAREDEIVKALSDRFHVSSEAARQAAVLSGGNFGEAIKLATAGEQDVSFLGMFQEFMRLALRFDGNKAFTWIDKISAAGREKHKQFLQYGLEVFRDCLMFNFGDRSLVRLGGAERAFLEKFAPYVNQKNYERLVHEFNTNYYYIERNANPKILFTDLMLVTNTLLNLK